MKARKANDLSLSGTVVSHRSVVPQFNWLGQRICSLRHHKLRVRPFDSLASSTPPPAEHLMHRCSPVFFSRTVFVKKTSNEFSLPERSHFWTPKTWRKQAPNRKSGWRVWGSHAITQQPFNFSVDCLEDMVRQSQSRHTPWGKHQM